MAVKNIPLTIVRPGVDGLSAPISFLTSGAGDSLIIPRRYPFVDISNYTALKAAGYFRHATNTVSTELGGSITTNTEAKLGYELPRTEKLILLVRVNTIVDTATTDDITIVMKGSLEYNIPDTTILIEETTTGGASVAAGTIFEIDLYNMGLFLEGVTGTPGVTITCDKITADFALIVRSA